MILHGLSYFSYDWIDLAAELATDRQIAVMDMRGFGDSGWAKDYSVPAFAGDVVALLDHLGWEKAILIGHSMGGRNCTWCAAEYRDRVAALMLLDWSPENAPAGLQRVTGKIGSTPDIFASVDEAMRFFKIHPDEVDTPLSVGRSVCRARPCDIGLLAHLLTAVAQYVDQTGQRLFLPPPTWVGWTPNNCAIWAEVLCALMASTATLAFRRGRLFFLVLGIDSPLFSMPPTI